MKALLKSIEDLKESTVKDLIDTRLREFKEIGDASNKEIFKELCFCILTAHYNAERSMKMQKLMGDDFLTLPKAQLAEKLKRLGHRYPDARAKYIIAAREYKNSMREIIDKFNNDNKLRDWFAKNIKGIGYKEASHFLRNIGYSDFAIIDFHILNVLAKHGLIEKPKTLTRKRYLEIEDLMKRIAKKAKLTLAELDLYLWYTETDKVLK